MADTSDLAGKTPAELHELGLEYLGWVHNRARRSGRGLAGAPGDDLHHAAQAAAIAQAFFFAALSAAEQEIDRHEGMHRADTPDSDGQPGPVPAE